MTPPGAGDMTSSRVTVPFHDPLSMRYRTLVIGPDHESSGAEHEGCDALAIVSPEYDSAYCSKCQWQARISGAWYVDITQAMWHGPTFEQHTRSWRIPADDGDYGVLVELQHEKSRHWFLLCPGSSTLYMYESDDSIDLTDCHDGEGCDYLDDVHAKAHLLVRHLDLIREADGG